MTFQEYLELQRELKRTGRDPVRFRFIANRLLHAHITNPWCPLSTTHVLDSASSAGSIVIPDNGDNRALENTDKVDSDML